MKMTFAWIMLLFCSLSISAVSNAQSLTVQNPVRFLALGDSYTIGQSVAPNLRWPAQLRDSLMTRGYTFDTIRYIATTGWRTDNLINAIKNQHSEELNYNLVSLLIGVNNQYQGRPFNQYVTEFPALVDSAIRYADGDPSKVFIVSIPDYAYTPFGQNSNPAQISAELAQYNAFNQHIADSLNITYFNITPISQQGVQHPEYVANDGLHPSGIQYTQWVKLMLEKIDEQVTSTLDWKKHLLQVTISPNPATESILIQFPENNSNQNVDAKIFNLTGQELISTMFHGDTCHLSIDSLPEGLYLLRIMSGDKYAIERIVKRS